MLLAWLSRAFDIRRGEGPTVARLGFALFLLIGAHTSLETARDALLLSRFSSRDLGLVYIAVALGVLPAAALTARLSLKLGPRATLIGALFSASIALVLLFTTPLEGAWVIFVYVVSGLVGAIIVPCLWALVGSFFNVAQGRRLIGPISSAAILGGASGSIVAAAAVRFIPVTALLLTSAATFVVAALVLPPSTPEERPPEFERKAAVEDPGARKILREPFVLRIALLVGVSTAAVLILDFFFKWSVARTIPHDRVPVFIARYYAALNVASLLAQLLLTRVLVRRLSTAATSVVTPLVLFFGSITAVATGGRFVTALVLKALDGTFRNSVHRATTELIYLPLPSTTRIRAKPLIDGALYRSVQACGGAILFAIGASDALSAPLLALLALVASAAWVATAWMMRSAYVSFLRRAIAGGARRSTPSANPLDMQGAEALVEYLSHDVPAIVIGAMDALARRGRGRLIPALILRHDDEGVLTRALRLFAESRRYDWITGAKRLLADKRESVRMAAARALAMHRRLSLEDLSPETTPRAQAYAAVFVALQDERTVPADSPAIREIIERTDGTGESARIGLVSAIADMPATDRLASLLDRLSAIRGQSSEWSIEIARAVSAQRATHLIPLLITLLVARRGREVVRSALVSFGPDALSALERTLHDPDAPRALRFHIPTTLARFGSKQAAVLLLETIESELDGLVRYKAIRALGRIVAERRIRLDRARIERLAFLNLVEHFRLLGLRGHLGAAASDESGNAVRRALTERILTGLLDDKLRQSLERAFRLLKIAHPHEDFHRVHAAYLSGDKRVRANAAELLDALFLRRDQARLRELIRIGAEEPSAVDALEKARQLLPHPIPKSRDEALALLLSDRDLTVKALAELHLAAAAGRPASVTISSGDRAPFELSLGEKSHA